MTLVEFINVTKKFGKVEALKNVNFVIPNNTVTAFLGPNGAGKTTSMKLMMGFLKPSEGEVKVFGEDPWFNESVRVRIGYLPERPVYPMDITVEVFLNHLAKLRGVGRVDVARIVRLVGLEEMLGKKVGSLSRGYLQRVGIAQSLLGDPELLILDEPTANLDPAARKEIIDLLKVLHKELKVSMIISSHIIPELQEVSNYAVFIDRGRVLEHGFLGELWKKYIVQAIFVVEVENPENIAKLVSEKPFVKSVTRVSNKVFEIAVDPEYSMLLENVLPNYGVKHLEFKTASLGDLYEKIVRSKH